MSSRYNFKMEFAKPEYREQIMTDIYFHKIAEILTQNEIDEIVITRLLSDLCKAIDNNQKELCDYILRYGKLL